MSKQTKRWTVSEYGYVSPASDNDKLQIKAENHNEAERAFLKMGRAVLFSRPVFRMSGGAWLHVYHDGLTLIADCGLSDEDKPLYSMVYDKMEEAMKDEAFAYIQTDEFKMVHAAEKLVAAEKAAAPAPAATPVPVEDTAMVAAIEAQTLMIPRLRPKPVTTPVAAAPKSPPPLPAIPATVAKLPSITYASSAYLKTGDTVQAGDLYMEDDIEHAADMHSGLLKVGQVLDDQDVRWLRPRRPVSVMTVLPDHSQRALDLLQRQDAAADAIAEEMVPSTPNIDPISEAKVGDVQGPWVYDFGDNGSKAGWRLRHKSDIVKARVEAYARAQEGDHIPSHLT